MHWNLAFNHKAIEGGGCHHARACGGGGAGFPLGVRQIILGLGLNLGFTATHPQGDLVDGLKQVRRGDAIDVCLELLVVGDAIERFK